MPALYPKSMTLTMTWLNSYTTQGDVATTVLQLVCCGWCHECVGWVGPHGTDSCRSRGAAKGLMALTGPLNGLIGISLIQNYLTISAVLIAKSNWIIYHPRHLRFKSFLKVTLSKLSISRRRLLSIITRLPLRLYIIHLIPVLRATTLLFKSEISYIMLKARLIFIYGSFL